MLLHRQIALGQVCQLTRQEYLIHGYLVNICGMARGALGLQTLLGRSILRRILEVCPQPVFTNPRGEKRTRRYIKSVVMYQQLFVRRFIVLVVFSFGNGKRPPFVPGPVNQQRIAFLYKRVLSVWIVGVQEFLAGSLLVINRNRFTVFICRLITRRVFLFKLPRSGG